MDNLTHSLAGAILGQMGLKKLSGRAMPTLIIAANLPDIDAFATVLGTQSLAIRRGITHGPIALAILPMVLTGLVLLYDRWRPSPQPVRPAALLLLAYIGTLSHPALDWLNSYGIRLLEPFSSRWYAGDTLFIIDIWIWAALLGSFNWSRRREKRNEGHWQRPAWLGFTAICAYIAANGLITGQAEAQAQAALERQGRAPTLVVANPAPVTFWIRKMLWRDTVEHGGGDYGVFSGTRLSGSALAIGLNDPRLAAARGREDVEAFLFWSRMPIVIEREGRAFLGDQRFNSSLTRDQFLIPLEPVSPKAIATE